VLPLSQLLKKNAHPYCDSAEGTRLSKFSGQKWRRGKQRNRQDAKGLDHDANNSSAVSQNEQSGEKSQSFSSFKSVEAGYSPTRPDGGFAAIHEDRRSTKTTGKHAGNGFGNNDGSPGILIGGSPANDGQTNESVSLDMSEGKSASFGDRPQGERKRSRRRTKRAKRPIQQNGSQTGSVVENDTVGSSGRSQAPALGKRQHLDSGARSASDDISRTAVPLRKKRNTRRKGAKTRPSDDGSMRHLRSPITPAPDVAYVPTVEARAVNSTPKRAKPFAKPRSNALYAALDLGTNNCRLLIATPQERGKFRVVDGYSKIVRLGEGLAHSGRLSEDAMNRAVEALKICSEKLMSHTVLGHRLIATEACRQAANGAHFLERVKAETGMDLEIIDRETEAYLAAEGCGALMDKKADAAVLFDIGGGSSELILVNCQGRKRRIAEQIVAWTSLPIGVVTLAERHGGAEVNKEIFQNMVSEVRDHLAKFAGRDALSRIWKNGKVHLLGTSGTVTTLAGIHLGLPRYERRLVDGLWLAGSEVDTVIKDLLAMDYRQRAASPCIGTERADLVMAGCAILEGIRQLWPSDRLRVADRGLREGMLTQLMERDSAWLPAKFGRRKGQRYWNQNRSNSNGSDKNRIGKE